MSEYADSDALDRVVASLKEAVTTDRVLQHQFDNAITPQMTAWKDGIGMVRAGAGRALRELWHKFRRFPAAPHPLSVVFREEPK